MSKYMKRVTVGYDYQGKQIQKRIYADTKYELERKVNEAKAARCSRFPFGIYAEEWLKTYKANVSHSSYEAYERVVAKMCGWIDPLFLEDIRPSDIQHIINDHAEHPQMCRKIRTTLNQIFERAVMDGIIDSNPVQGISLPKVKQVQRRILTEPEKEAISKVQLNDSDKAFLLCLFYFGLRPAEAYALKATSFDFALKTVCIDKAVEFTYPPRIKGTKTDSVRILPIPKEFREFIEDYCKDKALLFTMKNGEMVSKTHAKRKWERIKEAIEEELGYETDLHPYIFRYNYATFLYYSHVSLKKASYLMGHSNTNMILKIYAQLDDEREQLEELNNMLIFSPKEKS